MVVDTRKQAEEFMRNLLANAEAGIGMGPVQPQPEPEQLTQFPIFNIGEQGTQKTQNIQAMPSLNEIISAAMISAPQNIQGQGQIGTPPMGGINPALWSARFATLPCVRGSKGAM